jgi:hypothetical protein
MRTSTILLLSIMATGCTSTTMKEVHVSPEAATGVYDKLMVVGLGASDEARVEFESSITQKLNTQGVTSIPSNEKLPAAKDVTPATVRERAHSDGVDGVLVTRLVETKTESGYKTEDTDKFNQYWDKYASDPAIPAFPGEVKMLVIETKLFDVSTEEPVYTAVSEAFASNTRETVIAELVPLLVNDLSKRGLLPKR